MKNILLKKISRIIPGLLTLAIVLFCANLLVAQAPTPAHHWPLTEDLNDAVGDKHGTNHGVVFQNDDVRGAVAYFDGTAYANLPQIINGLTEVTIATWFRMDETQTWSRIYTFGTGDQTEPKDVLMVIPVGGNNGMYRFTLSNPGFPWYDVDFPAEIITVEEDTWYYSVVVLKPDSIIIYHNDQQVFAESGFDRPFGGITDVENALGKSFWPDPLWNGALSDFRVYTSALTEEQVMALYEETNAGGTNVPIHEALNAPQIYGGNRTIKVLLNEPYANETAYVYNVTGALVAHRSVHEIGRIDFDPGIYIVRVMGQKSTHTRKVVVR